MLAIFDWLDCVDTQAAVKREELSVRESLYNASQDNAIISWLGLNQFKDFVCLFVSIDFYL